MFYADLHVHSKYSLATSRDCDLEHLAFWAGRKGIAVLGTGDFTHPLWFRELRKKLIPDEPGLYRLRPGVEKQVRALAGASPHPNPLPKGEGTSLSRSIAMGEGTSSFVSHPSSFVRFMLQVEISTVYKKGGRTRKVHHVIYTPDFDRAGRLIKSLQRIGNLSSDGRPTLKLDSRDLLEIVLESGEECYVIPAHIWTPWFGVLGSKSGFDSIEECYGDLAGEIFAVETGLSADPATNWRLSSLDRFTSVSNSDAHSPANLGREASVFNTEIDYFSMFRALKKGISPIFRNGPKAGAMLACSSHKLDLSPFLGTVEFFPEEGRYHHDGHRKCGVCLTPEESWRLGGKCPVCGKPLTLGVMHRVAKLADRPETFDVGSGVALPPLVKAADRVGSSTANPTKIKTTGKMPVPSGPHAVPFRSMIPLAEVLAEIHKVGSKSKKIIQKYDELLIKIGPELFILEKAPMEEIAENDSPLLAEAISRMRDGRVIRSPGFDGQYGTIRLFTDEEL
jgi:DNA helicase II / ATP-dependent DNA helicase PcrA